MYEYDFPLYAPDTDPRIAKTPLYARAFDRFSQGDPNSPYKMDDDHKKRAFRQGLLNLAVAMSKPNGGNFTNSVATGLLAGTQSLNDAQGQYQNDAYRADIMKRTQDEMAANTAKSQAWQHLYGADGQIDPQGEAALRQADPQGYLSNMDKLHPPNDWTPKDVSFNGAQGTVLYNAKTGEMRTLDGQPFWPQQGAPAPMGGGASQLMGDALHNAVQGVESGGNPYAVSSAGAVGPMQTMPGTLRDPGFGVAPARDNTPGEQQRVGNDYIDALTQKYGLQGGLAAYNWGPGNWQAALGRYGSPDAALAHAPAETQAYVPKVLARGGSASRAPSAGLPYGFAPKKGEASEYDKRKAFIAQYEADNGPLPQKMKSGYLMTGHMAGEDGEAVLPAGTENLTGPDLLKALPSQDANMVRALVEGRKAWPTASAMKDPDWKRWTAEAQQYDNAADEGTFKTRLSTRQAFIKGTQGQQINAMNTTASHLAHLADAINSLDNGSPLLNPMVNFVKSKETNNTSVSNYRAVLAAVAPEMERLYRGSGGTQAGVDEWRAAMGENASKAQQLGVLKQWVGLIKGKLDAQQQQYDQGMGPMGIPLRMVNPNAQKAYDVLSGIVTKVGEDPASYGLPPASTGGHKVGDIITHNGKRYRITGGDMADPDVEEVR